MFTQKDLEIMNVIAQAGKPICSADIVFKEKSLSQSTVLAALRKLEDINAIKMVGREKSGKVYSRSFVITEYGKRMVLEYLVNMVLSAQHIVSGQEVLAELVNRVEI